MKNIPLREQQIITTHAAFICQVVQFAQHPSLSDELEQILAGAAEAGWHNLVNAIRRLIKGPREMAALDGLDEEDRVIAEAIMRGLQDPATLPDPQAKPEPAMAAPGLAGMIHAASSGDVQALTLISNMAEQMSRAGGSMARLAAVIRPLVNGERDAQKLCSGMNEETKKLVLGILDELGKQLH